MCPGPVTCLTTSPNGLYMLAGIAESIYLWEVSIRARVRDLWNTELDLSTVSCLKGDSPHFLHRQCRIWGQEVGITTSALSDLTLNRKNRFGKGKLSPLWDGRGFVISPWEL